MQDSGKRIIIDTYAWIEYFKGSSYGEKAKKFIEGNFLLFTPSIVIAELSDKYRRENINEWPVRKRFIKLKTKVLPLNEDVADKSGEIKQELKKIHKDASLADAIILAYSKIMDADILTGDKHLKGQKNAIDSSVETL